MRSQRAPCYRSQGHKGIWNRTPQAFIFEIDLAIRTQVIDKLEASPELPLSEHVTPSRKGVYVLYRKHEIVYAGKALDTTLKRRLGEHARKIAGR
jgi:hypothetical protein